MNPPVRILQSQSWLTCFQSRARSTAVKPRALSSPASRNFFASARCRSPTAAFFLSFIRSGTPILMVSNNSQLNIPIDALGVGPGSGPQFPSVRGPIKQVDAKLGSNIFSDPTLFTLPAPGTEGNVGRNVFRSPKFQNHDLAIFKNFHIKEGMRLQFRTEMFNFINHSNLSLPDLSFTNNGMITSFTDPNYGQWRPLTDAEKARGLTLPSRNFGVITSKTGDRRTVQLALKLIF